MLLVAMLALGIGAMLVKTYGPQPGYITDRMAGDGAATPAAGAAVSADPSIAVLPFVNRSSDAEQEYFSAGISEELLNLLAQIPELRVISRSSAFSFKGKDIAIPEIARQLNVAHILAATVVEQLKVTLLGEVPHAQETDPDSAPAHALLGWITMLFDNDLAQAARHVERALQLAPADLAIIRNAARLLHSLGRLDEAIVLEEPAITQDPVDPIGHAHLGAHYWIGTALLFKGEAEAALEAFGRESDEEYRVKGRALAAYALDREEEHQARLAELIERWGDQWPSEVAHVYAWTGGTDRAFEWLARSVAEEDGAFDPQHPMLWPLENDPRWLPLLEFLGKSPAQLQRDAIAFEVTLPGQ